MVNKQYGIEKVQCLTLRLQQHEDRSFQSHQVCLCQTLHKYAICINFGVNKVTAVTGAVSASMHLRTATSYSNLRSH